MVNLYLGTGCKPGWPSFQQSQPGRQPHASASVPAFGATAAVDGAQQPLPCQASRPP
jgi:hypothetical protein